MARRGPDGRGPAGVANLKQQELRRRSLSCGATSRSSRRCSACRSLLQASGFSLSAERLPDGHAELRIRAPWKGARMSTLACRPPLPGCVASGLGSAAYRVCARRSAVLPAHLPAASDTFRDPCHRGHAHLAGLPSRPDGHARRLGAAARHRGRVAVDLVPPRPAVRLAPSSGCIQRNRRWACARRVRTTCGTSNTRAHSTASPARWIRLRSQRPFLSWVNRGPFLRLIAVKGVSRRSGRTTGLPR